MSEGVQVEVMQEGAAVRGHEIRMAQGAVTAQGDLTGDGGALAGRTWRRDAMFALRQPDASPW